MPGVRYHQSAPPPCFGDGVAAIWSVRGEGELPIWPDGCVDLIADLQIVNGRIESVQAMVTSPTLRAEVATVEPDQVFVGLRLRPGAAAGLLGDGADAWAERLQRHLEAAHDESSARAILLRTVPSRQPPPVVRAALTEIARAGGQERIADLARRLGVSERTLARLFAEHAGGSPKAMARVARARRALRALSDPTAGLGTIAQSLGFADQAHLTRETSDLLGRTPGELQGVAPPCPISSRRSASAPSILKPCPTLDT